MATGLDDYVFPPILGRNAIATILADSVPAEMKFAVISLVETGIMVRETPSSAQGEEPVGLPCAVFDGI